MKPGSQNSDTSLLSSSGSYKYLQKHTAPQPLTCLEGIPPGAVGPASTYEGKAVKYIRNPPDSQKCLLLYLQDWSVFSASLLFSCSGPRQGKTWLKVQENRTGQISSSCREGELNGFSISGLSTATRGCGFHLHLKTCGCRYTWV